MTTKTPSSKKASRPKLAKRFGDGERGEDDKNLWVAAAILVFSSFGGLIFAKRAQNRSKFAKRPGDWGLRGIFCLFRILACVFSELVIATLFDFQEM